jgi:hypothetical protein
MTEEQCIVAFPELYQEADRAQEYFTRKGGISKKDVDAAENDGNARVVILNNTVSNYILGFPPANPDDVWVSAFRQGVPRRTQLQDAGRSGNRIQDSDVLSRAITRCRVSRQSCLAGRVVSDHDASFSSFVLQTGDTGSGKHPLFALSRKAREENVSVLASLIQSTGTDRLFMGSYGLCLTLDSSVGLSLE